MSPVKYCPECGSRMQRGTRGDSPIPTEWCPDCHGGGQQ
ncbi:zf-TFIIB domain-containing protein [Halomicrobium sp. IBSBa]|nr:zf-TFIIB domain-containing protein [Halomicrobium sp. IBSBa]